MNHATMHTERHICLVTVTCLKPFLEESRTQSRTSDESLQPKKKLMNIEWSHSGASGPQVISL